MGEISDRDDDLRVTWEPFEHAGRQYGLSTEHWSDGTLLAAVFDASHTFTFGYLERGLRDGAMQLFVSWVAPDGQYVPGTGIEARPEVQELPVMDAARWLLDRHPDNPDLSPNERHFRYGVASMVADAELGRRPRLAFHWSKK